MSMAIRSVATIGLLAIILSIGSVLLSASFGFAQPVSFTITPLPVGFEEGVVAIGDFRCGCARSSDDSDTLGSRQDVGDVPVHLGADRQNYDPAPPRVGSQCLQALGERLAGDAGRHGRITLECP